MGNGKFFSAKKYLIEPSKEKYTVEEGKKILIHFNNAMGLNSNVTIEPISFDSSYLFPLLVYRYNVFIPVSKERHYLVRSENPKIFKGNYFFEDSEYLVDLDIILSKLN